MAPQDELSGSAGKNTELLDALGNTLAAVGKVVQQYLFVCIGS